MLRDWKLFRIDWLWFIIFIAFIFTTPFSPHIAFFFSTLLLLTKYSSVPVIRNSVIAVALIMILFTAASRQISYGISDDLINTYMPIYYSQQWANVSSDVGIEFGYVFYINILNVFTQNLPPRGVLFFSILATLTLYYVWLVAFLLPKIESKYRGVISAIALLAFQVGILSQFLRQELATPLLLISLFYWADNSKKKGILFLILASLVHSSSLIIFIIFNLITSLKIKAKIIVLLLLFLFSIAVFKSPGAVSALFESMHLGFIAKKIAYYEVAESLAISQALTVGKFFFLIIIVFFIFRKDIEEFRNKDDFNRLILDFCFWGCLSNLSFLILPNAARLFLIIPGFLLPFILYPLIKKKTPLFIFVFIMYATVSLFFPQRLFAGGTTGFSLWDYYGWCEANPFYYIFDIYKLI
ncbi:EpsG family protein [Klebsiella aerogenes]|uniref:EpsG family protein n=1 Tax=Klebsiella aerogenes TaxID=548 RepID=UPI001D01353B|nr:EpsG family protein [Klebsiella aerogenes]MDG0005256.1 EpsG family protein [Klebsiella aerogenes]